MASYQVGNQGKQLYDDWWGASEAQCHIFQVVSFLFY